MPSRIANGRRGGFLVAAATAFGFVGLSWVAVPSQGREQAFEWLPAWVDRVDLGWVFLVASVVVVALALLWRVLPKRAENVAFGILSLPPSTAAAIFIGAFLTGNHETGWVHATTYVFYSLVVWIVSGWPNPPANVGVITSEIQTVQEWKKDNAR